MVEVIAHHPTALIYIFCLCLEELECLLRGLFYWLGDDWRGRAKRQVENCIFE